MISRRLMSCQLSKNSGLVISVVINANTLTVLLRKQTSNCVQPDSFISCLDALSKNSLEASVLQTFNSVANVSEIQLLVQPVSPIQSNKNVSLRESLSKLRAPCQSLTEFDTDEKHYLRYAGSIQKRHPVWN